MEERVRELEERLVKLERRLGWWRGGAGIFLLLLLVPVLAASADKDSLVVRSIQVEELLVKNSRGQTVAEMRALPDEWSAGLRFLGPNESAPISLGTLGEKGPTLGLVHGDGADKATMLLTASKSTGATLIAEAGNEHASLQCDKKNLANLTFRTSEGEARVGRVRQGQIGVLAQTAESVLRTVAGSSKGDLVGAWSIAIAEYGSVIAGVGPKANGPIIELMDKSESKVFVAP